MEQRIMARIEEYKRQRDGLVEQANRQIAALNGAIEALEELLRPEVQPPAEPEVEAPADTEAEQT